MADQITIEDLVDGAIIEGFRRGTASFMESLEMELQTEAAIEEYGNGDASSLLQEMINATVTEKSSQQVTENVESLGQKMNFLLNN